MHERIPQTSKPASMDGMLSEYIDDLMSIEHGECSRVSREVNHKVNLGFQEKSTKTEQLYRVDEFGARNFSTTADVISVIHEDIVLEGEDVKLVFVRSVLGEKLEREDKREGFIARVGRRAVAASGLKGLLKKQYDDPELGALIDGSIFVPLVGFRHREGAGICSYAQIGSGEMGQMSDEDYYAVITDEDGSRHEIMESVRKLIDGNQTIYWEPEDKKFLDFIGEEIKKNLDALADSRETVFAKLCFDILKKEGKPGKLLVLDEKDATSPEVVKSRRQISRCANFRLGKSGREIRFELVADGDSSGDSATLYAVTRQDVAISLMTIDRKNRSVSYRLSDDLSAEDRLHAARSFTEIMKGSVPHHINPEEAAMGGYPSGGMTITAVALIEAGLLPEWGLLTLRDDLAVAGRSMEERKMATKYGYEYLLGSGQKPKIATSEKVKAIGDYLQSPWRKAKPKFVNSRLLKLGLQAKENANVSLNELVNLFGVGERFDAALGETTPNQEILLERILDMAAEGRSVNKVLHDFPLKKTKVDLEFTADASMEGEVQFNFSIKGRPVGDTAGEAEYFQIVGDKLLPLLAQSATSGKSHSDYAALVYELLCKIDNK